MGGEHRQNWGSAGCKKRKSVEALSRKPEVLPVLAALAVLSARGRGAIVQGGLGIRWCDPRAGRCYLYCSVGAGTGAGAGADPDDVVHELYVVVEVVVPVAGEEGVGPFGDDVMLVVVVV